MSEISRRMFFGAFSAAGLAPAFPSLVLAQDQAAPSPPNVQAPALFGFDDVVKRAHDLASVPFDARSPELPEAVAKLDFDAWREIRFRPDKALLGNLGGPFRLHTFHLGHVYKTPVTVNIIRDRIVTPIAYSASLFDYGPTKFDKPLPVNLGFAGFRLHYPLNRPDVFDEVIAFLGASYFRFLGRHQHYGISARAIAIGSGNDPEEFPFFREFWIVTPEAGADHATIFGLMDGPSTTGAYRFDLYPGPETFIEITASLFPRRPIPRLGIAPLTSMFFIGENDKRFSDDVRPELHDSDGVLIHSSTGEWIWRPLRNPTKPETSTFLDKDVRGFGLLQRDRTFEHYQDLDLAYELRPSYWIEPREPWGEGQVQLIELPTADASNDNVVACWIPKTPPGPGQAMSFGYRITAIMAPDRPSPGGWAVNTFHTGKRTPESFAPLPPNTQRFIIDFTGGDLAFFINNPEQVQVVATTTNGGIQRSVLAANPHVDGFRASIDLQLDRGQSADLRVFLKATNRTLTETWTFPWKAE